MADSRRERSTVAGGDPRSASARAGDHAAIARLADELLPALIAKLGASGLGELEVREGAWHVRLRGGRSGAARPRTGIGDRAGRGTASYDRGAAAHDEPRAHPADGRDPGHRDASGGDAPRNGTGSHDPARGDDAPDPNRTVATSPAVGVFRPRQGSTPGTKVRAGDKVGYVEMLGIPQEVLAPVDGLVGATLVEPGDPVEYGQELIEIELAGGA
ncbi:MAG: Biotin-requiring enzyme [Chloroflexota bacterium]